MRSPDLSDKSHIFSALSGMACVDKQTQFHCQCRLLGNTMLHNIKFLITRESRTACQIDASTIMIASMRKARIEHATYTEKAVWNHLQYLSANAAAAVITSIVPRPLNIFQHDAHPSLEQVQIRAIGFQPHGIYTWTRLVLTNLTAPLERSHLALADSLHHYRPAIRMRRTHSLPPPKHSMRVRYIT